MSAFLTPVTTPYSFSVTFFFPLTFALFYSVVNKQEQNGQEKVLTRSVAAHFLSKHTHTHIFTHNHTPCVFGWCECVDSDKVSVSVHVYGNRGPVRPPCKTVHLRRVDPLVLTFSLSLH